ALHGRSRAVGGSHRDHRSRPRDCGRHACGPGSKRRWRRGGGGPVHPRSRVPAPDGKGPPRRRLHHLLAMIRKDLQLFFSDRRSVIVSFVVPIAIASFFGSIFSGPSRNGEPAKIAVMMVDHDDSAISKAIVAGAQDDKNFRVTIADDET